ncbi:MAG: SDR family oxidoreductase [Abyssibacter sp.]|nr:SDR family oxidoreductase [Abyssibacter sp.]MBB88339.1 2,4-dienoyl-CoA reductase [Xanthomonadales bacterium]MCK5860241.1 SDR family oxidoreductase [Abyssibacter sp.]
MSYASVLKPDLFAGQTVVVTGGGSGIGRCTAHELAALGAHVVVTGRTQSKLDTVVGEIIDDGGAASAQAFDIRDDDAVKAAIQAIVTARGAIHGLVNNAGGQFPSPAMMISKNGFDAVVRNNLTGGFLVAREVLLQSMRNGGGAIVNIVADMWGGMPGMAHSGAARAGMVNLTETLAVEWAQFGVRVNAVAPGWVASSGMDSYDPSFSREVIPMMTDLVPLKRMSTEAEVSSGICFLLSEGAAFISGTCLKIDGAASLNASLFPLPDHDRSKPYQGFHRYKPPKAVAGEHG